MSKVKVTTEKGNEFIEKNGILKAKVIVSSKEGNKVYISLDYGDNKQLLIGHFADTTTAENVIINDL